MKPVLNSQEVFLLERYISAEYFCELRDTWAEMVKHLEACLDNCMRNLPKNYRSRPLPEQPDVVWGHRVIPNFRKTLESLHSGYILLTHGDFLGLTCSWGVQSDFKGQMDYWSGWMPRSDENIYGELLDKAIMLARNISRTERAGWGPFDLAEYNDYFGPLNPPAQWPMYQVQANVSVATGQKLERSGIYVPDVEGSCAQFLFVRYETAPTTKVRTGMRPILHPTTGEQYDEEPILEERNCTWYLVERASGAQGIVRNDATTAAQHIRVPGGQACPETGFYFTPAKTESRRLFRKGEAMPTVDSGYGRTIWQWDSNQS
ncbi:hypothetical protein G4G28_07005 [Massilia sp. Dwa41.01b]|uniref:hypothetical protein n=1 Tax=unclassified Massilia TaxID=2609279 RepID=UPI001604540F|nr:MULTISPECIES: hypothetical protein [unclassified Massilia]QNA88313.1 hypothetical protein G4G28_07005 [Massilia sp. Dwa41.01b]QNA99214.1 hypothetical protein G4G31_10715 [Massilia sp. Se16.2.3]